MMSERPVSGTGLGLRRALFESLSQVEDPPIDFLEVAPENWIPLSGHDKSVLRAFTERFPFVTHGLSLSLGGPEPLDFDLLARVRDFLDEHGIRCYTEHLSYCGDAGHLYDLMPIPFTEEAVHYVADRIRRVQDFLGRRIGIEHVSYYAMPSVEGSLPEPDFINAVLEEADCGLLLDVNNAYVNGINHGYDAADFIRELPGERIVYVHIAGHADEAPDLKIDTHGSDISDPVWDLLDLVYARFGVLPTLLERDTNIPPLADLYPELRRIGDSQRRAEGRR